MSAARPTTDSSTVSRVLASTTLALRVAREATDSVSIAKQILGSAAHISEFAEKIEKNRKAMNDLIAKSAEYACHIDTIVAGRIVEGKVLSILRRLCSVFTRIEALVVEAAAVKKGVKRRLHNIFTAPNKASELSSQLEKEMQLFQLAMMLDVRLAIGETAEETLRAIQENALYDSDGFRRLRPADVRKLEELPTEWWLEDSNVAFSKARVDGELMVIRYPRSSGPLPSAWASNFVILKELSYPTTQHSNVVQLYGQSVGDPENAFVAFRSGCHRFRNYVAVQRVEMSPQSRAAKAFEMVIKLLDASRHIEHLLDLVWHCKGWNGNFAVDDECNPTIGLFRDVSDRECIDIGNLDWVLRSWNLAMVRSGVLQEFQVVRAIASESKVPNEIAQILQRLQDVNPYVEGCSHSMPIDYTSTSLVPATVALAREDFRSLVQKPGLPDSDMNLWQFHLRALVLGPHQCKSVWNFQYRTGYTKEEPHNICFERCWIENGSRRYEDFGFYLDEALAVECREILGYQTRKYAEYQYCSDRGWLKRP